MIRRFKFKSDELIDILREADVKLKCAYGEIKLIKNTDTALSFDMNLGIGKGIILIDYPFKCNPHGNPRIEDEIVKRCEEQICTYPVKLTYEQLNFIKFNSKGSIYELARILLEWDSPRNLKFIIPSEQARFNIEHVIINTDEYNINWRGFNRVYVERSRHFEMCINGDDLLLSNRAYLKLLRVVEKNCDVKCNNIIMPLLLNEVDILCELLQKFSRKNPCRVEVR